MPETISHKACSKCKEVKPASAFVKVPTAATGLASWCMKCKNAAAKSVKNAWKKKPESIAKMSAYRKRYFQTEKGKAFLLRKVNRIRPKTRVRQSAKKALRAGRIIRKTACENCGSTATRIEMHHYLGYAWENRWNVQFLCVPCHRAADRAANAAAAAGL